MERALLEFVVRTTLIAALTGLMLALLRIKTAGARHAAWVGVILAMLLLPGWMAWGPKASLPVLPARVAAVADEAPVAVTEEDLPVRVETQAVVATKRSVWNWSEVLLGGYALGAFVMLLRLAIGTMRARRLTSTACSAPVTVGLFRPRIILPESAGEWSRAQLDAVMTHEGAHARRRDPLFQWLALLNRAVFWFHPLAWWIEQRLGALAEEACDAAVIESGHDPREYSMCLLEMARAVERAGTRVNVVAMAMPGVYLPRRIKSIISGVRAPRVSRARLACAALACSIPAGLLVAGTLGRVPEALPLWPLPARPVPEAPVLIAQAAAPVPAAPTAPVARLEFEVASVRPITEPGTFIQSKPGRLLANISGNRFTQRWATVPSLIMDAYNVRDDQFTGLPDWASDSNKYEISAKTAGEGAVTPDQARLMLQALLADRFRLKLNHETKNLTVYELTVGKGGAKLKLFPDRTGEHRNAWGTVSTFIEFYVDYPVMDKTGLAGFFDTNYVPKWDEAKLREEQPARPAGLAPGVGFHGLSPSIFHEVEAEFGLTLKKVTAPSDFLVIEHVEKPTEN